MLPHESPKGEAPWLAPVPIESVTLRREGKYVLVEIQAGGVRKVAIRELHDNEFDHQIHQCGIRTLFGMPEPSEAPKGINPPPLPAGDREAADLLIRRYLMAYEDWELTATIDPDSKGRYSAAYEALVSAIIRQTPPTGSAEAPAPRPMEVRYHLHETVDEEGSVFRVVDGDPIHGEPIHVCRDPFFAATLVDCLNRYAGPIEPPSKGEKAQPLPEPDGGEE
jgi:hypothetical protein